LLERALVRVLVRVFLLSQTSYDALMLLLLMLLLLLVMLRLVVLLLVAVVAALVLVLQQAAQTLMLCLLVLQVEQNTLALHPVAQFTAPAGGQRATVPQALTDVAAAAAAAVLTASMPQALLRLQSVAWAVAQLQAAAGVVCRTSGPHRRESTAVAVLCRAIAHNCIDKNAAVAEL
jgi:hypothetical protein